MDCKRDIELLRDACNYVDGDRLMGEPIFRIDFLKSKVFDEHLKIQQAIITVDEEINNKLIRELYTIYKNSKFDSIYIISEPEFKKFLLECLPKYLNKEELENAEA